ncbi:SprB repeat-containing protein [Niastella populi]|uniref:Ig-like domain-containing protein n=1 Tax=Niastella populi TaxID=550983 RepID=A0A1V9FGR8_9BACT|nr:SprB repeat-containing protein [Niastella populi]OQP57569.1 hypothetical protein A4R26_23880 [Niastella populi]
MRYFVPVIYMGLSLLISHVVLAQCPSVTPLSITGITTTESRCQASGTAEVQLSGGTAPFVYSIISGPVQFPGQSSNQFQSLPPGNYTARVVDNCNTTFTANFTIAGSYTVPQPFSILTPPRCPGASDGSITVNITNGRSPYTYALISPSPVIRPSQTSNQFTGLAGGSYTYEVTDSCGNFQTRTVTLPDGNDGAFLIDRGSLHYIDCDSFYLPYRIYAVNPSHIRAPYTMTLTLPDGTTKTHVITNTQYIDGYIIRDTFHFRYHHQHGALDNIPINAVNSCGASAISYGYMNVLDMWPNRYTSGTCNRNLRYAFDPASDNGPGSFFVYRCNTVQYSLYSPAGILLASQTNNSSFSGHPPGIGYKVVREDCCGKDSITFNWEERPLLNIYSVSINPADVCKEGAAGIDILINNLTLGDIIVASGPPSITFPDGTVHNYIYPDTMRNMPFGSTGVRINYFGAGTYTIYAVDTCGERDTATFTITPAQLRHSSFTANLIKGCINDNRIVFNAGSNGAQYDATININGQLFYTSSYPAIDSAVNIPAGTYSAMYAYRARIAPWSFLTGMSGYACDTIQYEIVVPPYAQPAFVMAPAVAVCGSNRFVALLPDSTTGVFPYRYRYNTGATTSPLQTGNVFSGLSAGLYNFLIADGCGNSFSNSVAIDTLALPAVSVTGAACLGSSTTLTLPANPYYTYNWQHPDGSTTAGNTLTMDPVTTTHLGNYQVSVTSNVNGCTDHSSGALQVNDCMVVLPLKLIYFTGDRLHNNIVLKWKTAEEANTSHFDVERSTDGVHFTTIQQVKASGTLTGNYSATDNQPLAGKLFYRLKMVDKDGKFTNSSIITINSDGNGFSVTPQLITNNCEIKLTYAAAEQPATIQIAGIDGRLWLTQAVAKGSVQTTIPTNGLATGSYLVIFINNGKRTAVRVVKL